MKEDKKYITKKELVEELYKSHTEGIMYGIARSMRNYYDNIHELTIGTNRITIDYCNLNLNDAIRTIISRTLCESFGFAEEDIIDISTDPNDECGQIIVTVNLQK